MLLSTSVSIQGQSSLSSKTKWKELESPARGMDAVSASWGKINLAAASGMLLVSEELKNANQREKRVWLWCGFWWFVHCGCLLLQKKA